jgi:antitoxin Phd
MKISATEAKNRLGEVLDNVIQGGMVLITKHQTPKVVLLSMDEYDALSRATETRLDTLNGEFDALLARMQTAKARAGLTGCTFPASTFWQGRMARGKAAWAARCSSKAASNILTRTKRLNASFPHILA